MDSYSVAFVLFMRQKSLHMLLILPDDDYDLENVTMICENESDSVGFETHADIHVVKLIVVISRPKKCKIKNKMVKTIKYD